MTEKKWNACRWDTEFTRPTEPGFYRVLLKGVDDDHTHYDACGDYQAWAEVYPLLQDYKAADEKVFGGERIPDGEPYHPVVVQHNEEVESIIAWLGPFKVPGPDVWNPVDEDKPDETLPQQEGHYRVLIAGDSEYDGPHCYYDFPDYEVWMTVKKNEPDELRYSCEFDEEPNFILSWFGPINVPEVDCYS